MLREHWYIAANSRDLTAAKPLGRLLLGEKLALWRDHAGVAHAVADTCIHRGVPLSLGRIDGDCLRCPYHGWAYNGEGRCTQIPANGKDAPVPGNARTRAYPVEERGGYIWVYTGTAPASERRPLAVPEELTSSVWVAGYRHDDIEAHYTRVIEHNIDVAHLPWVHPKSIGRTMPLDERIYRPMVTRENGLTLYMEGKAPDIEVLPGPFYRRVMAGVSNITMPDDGLHFDMPNLFRISFASTGVIMGMYSVPLDEKRTRIYQYVARCWLRHIPLISRFFSWLTVLLNYHILREDLAMLEAQSPHRMPEDLDEEFHVRTDEAQIYYRKLRDAYFAKHPAERPSRSTTREDIGGWAAVRPVVGKHAYIRTTNP